MSLSLKKGVFLQSIDFYWMFRRDKRIIGRFEITQYISTCAIPWTNTLHRRATKKVYEMITPRRMWKTERRNWRKIGGTIFGEWNSLWNVYRHEALSLLQMIDHLHRTLNYFTSHAIINRMWHKNAKIPFQCPDKLFSHAYSSSVFSLSVCSHSLRFLHHFKRSPMDTSIFVI